MVCKAQEIYDCLVSEFPHGMQEISALSRNDQAGNDFIRCDIKAFNFDILLNFKTSENKKEKSPDALFLHDETFYFVEFKEGKHERSEVRQKIHEGINTLYQYAFSRGIADRSSFFGIRMKYALVRRFGRAGENRSFLQELEKSQDIFSLKNLEGWIVNETAVRTSPESIFKLLKKISNGSVNCIEYIHCDQLKIEKIN